MTTPARTLRPAAALALAIACASLACSGPDGTPGADGTSVLLRTADVAPGAECASGGVRVQTGADDDRDLVLDDAEVDATVFVCDGADGQSVVPALETPGGNCEHGGVALTVGEDTTYVCNGATGAAGQDGLSVTVTAEAAGASCPYGGARLQVGAGTPTYVCDGAPGATGLDGESVAMTPEPEGTNCPYGGQRLQVGTGTPTYVCNGAPGAAGQDGLSVTVTAEPAGGECAYGGQRLQVGGGASSYVCDGAPGATGQDGVSVTMTPEPAGDDCAYGGQRLQVGGGTPAWVCNGAPGAAGEDGLSVTMTPEPAGPNCVFGGVVLQVGAGPASYLCSGAAPGVTLPTVETVSVTGVRYAAAVVNVLVADDGGELVLARGVVLAADGGGDPQVLFSGGGTGSFAIACPALAPATTYRVRAFASNALGTSYGAELSFTTLALTVPTLTTKPASSITTTTAFSGGDVSDDGGAPVFGRGICWGLAADPALGGSCADEGEGAGSFVALATGLTQSTAYHVRAYATNAQGTAYGDDRSFTTTALPLATIVTSAASGISYTSATGGGNVTSDNGAAVSQRGVCWGTSPSPTTAGAKAISGSGVGSFTASIAGLAAGTTYYVRAYAVSSAGTSYGNEVSFTTLAPALPTLTTKAMSGISSDIAGSGGVIAADGGLPITARGVCWSLNPNPSTLNSKTSDGTGTASFNSTITGLNPLTTYYVRAYATNALGTAYGNELTFTTTNLVSPGPTVPTVGTSTTAMATGSTAAGGGYVSSDGGSAVTARGLCWSTSQNPTLAGTCSNDGGTGKGFFTSTITGLGGCAQVYYVRAYATNSTGTAYGNQVTVSTGLLPTVSTAAVTDVAYTTATSGGAIVDNGGCSITARGVVWALTPNPTTSNFKTTDGSGDGAWVTSLTGLFANKTIYARAYATNSVGTAYGDPVTFTTLEPAGPYIGRNWAGGMVFYLDGTGQHGLVVANSDAGSAPWGCYGKVVGTGNAVGTGATNTAAIMANCTDPSTAAKLADSFLSGGYDDWFLPSQGELELVYTNLYAQGLVTLGNYYWSSSENNGGWEPQNNALYRSFVYNFWTYDGKNGSRPVRAVRAF